MSLTKKLDNLSDVLTGALITSIVGHVLTLLKPEHQKNKKHAKKHSKKHANKHHLQKNKKNKHQKHNNQVACTNVSFKDVLPIVLGTTTAVKGVKEGNKHNIFVSALFTVIAFNLFIFKRK